MFNSMYHITIPITQSIAELTFSLPFKYSLIPVRESCFLTLCSDGLLEKHRSRVKSRYCLAMLALK